MAWHTSRGWMFGERVEALLERIVLSVNDRPIALYGSVRYDSTTAETVAGVGVRVVVLDRRDPRVSLDPPRRGVATAP